MTKASQREELHWAGGNDLLIGGSLKHQKKQQKNLLLSLVWRTVAGVMQFEEGGGLLSFSKGGYDNKQVNREI